MVNEPPRRVMLGLRREFSIETSLTPVEARERLANGIVSMEKSRRERADNALEGLVKGDSFEARRVTGGRNSFRAQITGRVEPAGSGSRVVGVMRLHPVVLVFMAIWILAAGLSAFVGVRDILVHGVSASPVIPLMMLGLGLAMLVGGFAIESRKAMTILADLMRPERPS